jgi:hypothetical protein
MMRGTTKLASQMVVSKPELEICFPRVLGDVDWLSEPYRELDDLAEATRA